MKNLTAKQLLKEVQKLRKTSRIEFEDGLEFVGRKLQTVAKGLGWRILKEEGYMSEFRTEIELKLEDKHGTSLTFEYLYEGDAFGYAHEEISLELERHFIKHYGVSGRPLADYLHDTLMAINNGYEFTINSMSVQKSLSQKLK